MRKKSIKYQYALNSDEEIISINNVKRKSTNIYRCLGCGQQVIPKKGDINKHHFAHKHIVECSEETYLHKLAKKVFMREYKLALEREKPFYLNTILPYRCGYYFQCTQRLCKREILEKVDLTKYFKVIKEEYPYDGVIPDIFLSSEDGKQILFIEMAVTHMCEENKIDLGYRIVEFLISDESDITSFLERDISENSEFVKTYNFDKKLRDKDVCGGDCKEIGQSFVVHKSQKAIMLDRTYKQLCTENVRGSPIYIENIFPEGMDEPQSTFIDKIRECFYQKNIPIKNCFLCKYHGLDGVESAIFCKAKKISCSSNEAADCDIYSPFKSKELAESADTKNKEYLEKNQSSRLVKMLFRGRY